MLTCAANSQPNRTAVRLDRTMHPHSSRNGSDCRRFRRPSRPSTHQNRHDMARTGGVPCQMRAKRRECGPNKRAFIGARFLSSLLLWVKLCMFDFARPQNSRNDTTTQLSVRLGVVCVVDQTIYRACSDEFYAADAIHIRVYTTITHRQNIGALLPVKPQKTTHRRIDI